MASLVASLVTELTVDLTKWRSEMGQAAQISNTRLREIQRNAETSVKSMEKVGRSLQSAFGMIGVGLSVAGIVSALKSATLSAIQFGDEVQKASLRTGIGAAAFAQLSEAAKLSDVSMEGLSKGLRGMQVIISNAASGNKAAAETFKALAINVDSLKNLSADQQLKVIADQISRLKNDADKTAIGVQVFGKAWTEIAPFLLEGAKGIEEAQKQMRALGTALTDEQIAKLSEADDAIKRLRGSWERFARTMIADVAPALSATLDALGGNTLEQIEASLAVQMAKLEDFKRVGMRGSRVTDLEAEVQALRQQRGEMLALMGIGQSGPLRRTGAVAGLPAPPGPMADVKAAKPPELTDIAIYSKRIYDLQEEQRKALSELDTQTFEEISKTNNQIANDTLAHLEEMTDAWKTNASEWSVFADEAGRQMQESFANFLFDPFAEGLRGMLTGFIDTVRRMVAELAAQQLLRMFFNWAGGAIGGSFGNFISGIGAPGRASGGPVYAGNPYTVGEHGPELFVPSSNGRIVPNGAGAISMTYNIDARGADADRIMSILPPMLKQTKDQTISEILRLQRQGRFA